MFPSDKDADADPLTFIEEPGVADRLIATALPALAHSRTRLTATFIVWGLLRRDDLQLVMIHEDDVCNAALHYTLLR